MGVSKDFCRELTHAGKVPLSGVRHPVGVESSLGGEGCRTEVTEVRPDTQAAIPGPLSPEPWRKMTTFAAAAAVLLPELQHLMG